jgi:hypothetical protein
MPTDHPSPHIALAPPALELGRLDVEPPSPLAQLRALQDAELRLLAQATGEHLAPELADRVLELRARRAAIWSQGA